ncbi:MAG: protein translocase SEC61 complex subunit gamma [Candidatus Micrarchaeota archaeon]
MRLPQLPPQLSQITQPLTSGIDYFIQRSTRVLRVSYKPTMREFRMTAKITSLGMMLIGLVGFLITVVFMFIDKK